MSPPKLNSLLTGVFVAMFIAVGSSVLAQDNLRLFKPYPMDTFGKSRFSNDGVYGSVSGIYWQISTPTGGYLGATTTKGADDTRWTYIGATSGVRLQNNSLKINRLDSSSTLGTRFEFGNRLGHHGWLVTGYGLPGQSHQMGDHYVSMCIRDEGHFSYQPAVFSDLAPDIFIWDRSYNTLYSPVGARHPLYPQFSANQYIDGTMATEISGLGYLWGYFEYEDPNADPDVGAGTVGVFAPLPVSFERVDVSVRTEHQSADLVYTYRMHPPAWGAVELLAGVKYWDFDDRFGLAAGPADPTVYEEGGEVEAFGYSALGAMAINARGTNRVFGPQVGMKFYRSNARWTFGAEGRLTAGINAQSVRTEGYVIPNPEASDGGVPIGFQSYNGSFGHRQNKTYFSPIGELRLTADWQATNAVSFFGGVNGMWAGNIARGVRVTDYVVSEHTLFGLRGNDRNTSVLVYGLEFGLRVIR